MWFIIIKSSSLVNLQLTDFAFIASSIIQLQKWGEMFAHFVPFNWPRSCLFIPSTYEIELHFSDLAAL